MLDGHFSLSIPGAKRLAFIDNLRWVIIVLVHLFHAPILIALTLGMRGFVASRPVKVLVATVLAALTTYVASHFVFRRIPLLQRMR